MFYPTLRLHHLEGDLWSIITTMRGLDLRGPRSRRIVFDTEGAMLGADCVLVRRTSRGCRCTSFDEAAKIQNVLRHQFESPGWLFRQCCRIAKALDEGHVTVAQIYGLFIRTESLDDGQVKQLAALAPVVKANFNPDEPREAHGRWTDLGDIGRDEVTSQSTPAVRHPNARIPITQLAADNRRQNKMVTDIVVQLRLDKDQREQLHRAISGQGLGYQEILRLAREMFNK